uniref:Protoporphyrinogen oxidase n=1 Tax=Strigomonas oncopelti TaxID=5657 RepID=G1C9P1_STROO|nr:protoporphyrinogen oxidase [Strigomonas oncopelti]
MKYLILFSTSSGHTKVIADTIADTIRAKESGAECTVQDIKLFMTHNTLTAEGVADMKNYNKVILGASIRYGYFAQEVHQFVKQYAPYLNSIPTGFFTVNMTARKENKATPETNPYAQKFLRGCPWKPTKSAVFAGALYYPRYSFFDRNVIRVIMKMTGGDTDPKTEKVYTDWDSVKAFAEDVVALTADDACYALELSAEAEKKAAVEERSRNVYRMCVVGAVAVVGAISRVLTQKKLLK